MTEELMIQAINILVPPVLGLIVALLTWLLAEAANYVRKRTGNEIVNNAITRLCSMTETVVAELNQEFVDTLRKKTEDGRLSIEDRMELRQTALNRIRNRLAPEVLKIAAKGLADLDGFIGSRIERAVREQKAVKV